MIILKRPIITEKSMKLAQSGLYAFEVNKWVTKPQVVGEVAQRFGVKVLDVKSINVKGEIKQQRRMVKRKYRTKGYKKILVQLKKGDKIALFETPKEEVTVTTAEDEAVKVKEKKDLLGRTKVKVEKTAVGAAPTTQRKVITGK
jgi:large subunit ribosomal protein L23